MENAPSRKTDDSDAELKAFKQSQPQTVTRLQYIGNQYSLKAGWNERQEDVWQFTSFHSTSGSNSHTKSSSKQNPKELSTFVVRVSNDVRKEIESQGGNIFLLIELTMHVQMSKEASAKPVEVGCGWCSIAIEELDECLQHRRYIKAPVRGGSPLNPCDIHDEDIRARRTGWRALTRSLRNSEVQPELQLRCHSINRSRKNVQASLRLLPSTVITSHGSLPLIAMYQEVKNEAAKVEKNLLLGVNVRNIKPAQFKPALRIFPKLLQDPELMHLLTKKWQKSNGPFTRSNEARRTLFCQTVLDLWPLLCTVDRSSEDPRGKRNRTTLIGGKHVPSPRKNNFIHNATPSHDLFFLAVPEKAIKGRPKSRRRGDNAPNVKGRSLLFKPFNISETVP